jgi:hypothetical protein
LRAVPLPTPSARGGQECPWSRALAALDAAEAELKRFELFCSGRSFEAQEELDEGYGDRLCAMNAALRRAMRVRAPDLPALARKIALAVDHDVGSLSGGEACLATLKRDAQRLCSGGKKVDAGSSPA